MENETSESIDENEEDGKVITVPDVATIFRFPQAFLLSHGAAVQHCSAARSRPPH